MSSQGPLDVLVAHLLAASPYRFTVATDQAEREVAYRLRARTVVERGWAAVADLPDGLERDAYDDRAVQVVGWAGDEPVTTGRIVLPPGPLPTEDACGVVVEPVGEVVDVGRMLVVPSFQDPHHRALRDLLACMYLEVRARGYTVACGMMTDSARALARQLGLSLTVLGAERTYWHERRSPIRFDVPTNLVSLMARWADVLAEREASRAGENQAGVGPAEPE